MPTPPPAAPATGTTGTSGLVRLADQTVTAAAVKRTPARHNALLSRARSEVGHAVCLCRTDKVVKLVIRCRAGRYHLATWPSGGHQHAPGCPWYRSPASVSGRSTVLGAIATTEDGTCIRLATPLEVRGATSDTPKRAAATTATGSTGRRALGHLALLHYLWESAQLNVWHPHHGRRSWRTCHTLLADQARDCRINDKHLADTLWIVPAFDPTHVARINTAWTRYLDRLRNTTRIRDRGLVLGEIRAVAPTPHGVRVQLAHQKAALFASTPLWQRVRRSYPAALSDHATRSRHRQVVLCLIERSSRGYPVIVDLAAMLTTNSYLPIDSSYEGQMADALTATGRAFLKPLHYDGGEVFPDFVLIDTDPPTYVEVWGVRGRETYETRKRAKQAHYREHGMTLVEWNTREPIPNLAGIVPTAASDRLAQAEMPG